MENQSTTCSYPLIGKADIYVLIAFFLMGGIQMTFTPVTWKASLISLAYVAVIIGLMTAIVSPLSVGKRFLKALVLIISTVLAAGLGCAFGLFSVPLATLLVWWNLYRGKSEIRPASEYKKNITALNFAFLAVAVLSLVVFFSLNMYKEEYSIDGLSAIVGYHVYRAQGESDLFSMFSSEIADTIRVYKTLINCLFVLFPVGTTIAIFSISNRVKSHILSIVLIPSYLVLFLGMIALLDESTDTNFVPLFGLFDAGFHFYFILAHIAALLAIARSREVKLLSESQKTVTETAPQEVILEDGIKGNIGVVGFILVILYYILGIVAAIFPEIARVKEIHFTSGLMFLQLVGLLCSIAGRSKTKRHRKLATAGVLMCVIPWAIFILMIPIILNFMYIEQVLG